MQRDQIAWGPAVIGTSVFMLCTMTVVATAGNGYLRLKSISDFVPNPYNPSPWNPSPWNPSPYNPSPSDSSFVQKDYGLFDRIARKGDLKSHQQAAQAFAIMSFVAFLPSLALSVIDFKNGAVSKRCAASLFVPALFVMLTWVLEVTLFTRSDSMLQDIATLSWGFGLFVAVSVLTCTLGVVALVAIYVGTSGQSTATGQVGYVPQGQLAQTAVPLQQSYVPPQIKNTYPQQAGQQLFVNQQGMVVQPGVQQIPLQPATMQAVATVQQVPVQSVQMVLPVAGTSKGAELAE